MSMAISQPLLLSDRSEWGIFIIDANGNMDTLTFGTHPLAKANFLVSEIGEKRIDIPDSNSLFFVINKSEGLKTKKSFGVAGAKETSFFTDSIFFKSNFTYQKYAPVFISGKAIHFPLKLRIKKFLLDSTVFLGYLHVKPYRIHIGEYGQSVFNFPIFFGGQYDTTYILQKEDVKFRTNGLMAMYIDFENFIVSYSDKIVDEISIFPNPSKDFLQIRNTGNSLFKSYSIFDYAGRMIRSERRIPMEIDIRLIPIGIYTMIFETNDGKKDIKKFVVSR